MSNMRVVRLLLLVLALLVSSLAYTAKKQEQRRPAFKASPMATKEEPASGTKAVSTSGNTAAFGFPPAAVAYTSIFHYQQEEDGLEDEELIGYGTALISCVLSLAIGFGLGYGT